MGCVKCRQVYHLQLKDSTLKKCFDQIGRPIIREKYVGEFFMENGLLYGAKTTEDRILRNFFGQDYARISSDFAVPVTSAKEQSRGVVSRRYH